MEAVSSDGELEGPLKARKVSVGLAMLGEMQQVLEDLWKELQDVETEALPADPRRQQVCPSSLSRLLCEQKVA